MKIERNIMFWHADSDPFGDYASIFKNQQVPFHSEVTSTHQCNALFQIFETTSHTLLLNSQQQQQHQHQINIHSQKENSIHTQFIDLN